MQRLLEDKTNWGRLITTSDKKKAMINTKIHIYKKKKN